MGWSVLLVDDDDDDDRTLFTVRSAPTTRPTATIISNTPTTDPFQICEDEEPRCSSCDLPDPIRKINGGFGSADEESLS